MLHPMNKNSYCHLKSKTCYSYPHQAMQHIVDFLSQHTHITEEELNDMMQVIHFSSHKKNEILQQQGGISKRAAFVVKGAVRIFYLDEKGTEHTINFIFENYPLVSFDSFTQQTPVAVSAITL